MLKFKYDKPVRLVALKSLKSKNGADLHFVNVADKDTFASQEFMLNKNDCDPFGLVAGTDYLMTLEVDGRFSSLVLSPIPAK